MLTIEVRQVGTRRTARRRAWRPFGVRADVFGAQIWAANASARTRSGRYLGLGQRVGPPLLPAPTQTDARPFFVRGRPIPGPFFSLICVGADTRRARPLAYSCSRARWSVAHWPPLPRPTSNPCPRLLCHRRRRPFLPATLPAVAASTSAQKRRPCPQSPAAAVLPPGSKLLPTAASPTAKPPATKKPPRRPCHIRPARSSHAVTLVGCWQGS